MPDTSALAVVADAIAHRRHEDGFGWMLDAQSCAFAALDALVAAGWHVIRIEPDEDGQAHHSGQRCRLGDEWTPHGS